MTENPIIPEFMMYSPGLELQEIEQLESRMIAERRTDKDPFMQFTDVLLEFVGSGEWRNRSDAFLAMCAKASFLRGKYGFNQVLARGSTNLACKGYAAAAYCRQSLDPRWLNNLRNITNQAWQAKDYVVFAELSGELAAVLIELGYTDHATEVATVSIEKVTKESAKNQDIRTMVQSALLRARIIHAYIASTSVSWEEAFIRLDSAEDTARHLNHQLALTDITYNRGRILVDRHEYDRVKTLLAVSISKYENMGYLHGLAVAKNTEGVLLLNIGQLQDARDTFEELLIIQQQLNNQIGLAKTLINVGEIDRTLGQIDQMETYNRRALEISQEAEYIIGIATATANLGDVELRKGNVADASDLYEQSIKLAEDAGMKSFLVLALFLTGDAHFLTGEFKDAIAFYKRAREVSDEIGWPLSSFNADVSVLVTQWAQEVNPDPEIVKSVDVLMGKSEDWLSSRDSNLMREVRRKVYDDSSMESDLCAFYDGERNFECRVERKALAKECFGNLFWMGSLCPYFKEFLARFYGQ
ncbi:MAG: tetratricopeptide repeat protein [Candidatus Thorarchaeota archaeon]